MDLDVVADELYAGAREEFMALRAERAAQAKEAGDGDLARRITKLRKPSTAAWLINRLAREHSGELGALAELGTRMREAHQSLDGGRMREVAAQRRSAVRELIGLARPLAGSVSESVFDQVQDALDAAVTSPEVAAAVASGRLDTAAGLDSTAGFDQLPAATPRQAPEPVSAPGDAAAAEPAIADERAQRRHAALERAREEAAAAEAEHEQARRAAAEAEADADAAAATARDLRSQLARAERRERRARAALADAQRTAEAAGRAASAARRAVDRLSGS